MRYQDTKSGFTLVELAIVITIIGLLIGGVLKGQELIDNSRITATVSQLTAYQTAVMTYTSMYKQLPGDGRYATERIQGCTAANSCVNGDGNGMVGVNNGTPWWSDIEVAIAGESTQFWKHLALAGLISGVQGSASAPAWDSSHPRAKTGNGGYFAKTFTGTGEYHTPGLSMKMMDNISGVHDYAAISPFSAWRIDDKLDDGQAITGSIVAVSYAWNTGCGVPNAGTQGPTGYDIKLKTERCQQIYNFN